MLWSIVISGREMRLTQMLSVRAQDMKAFRAVRVVNSESHHGIQPRNIVFSRWRTGSQERSRTTLELLYLFLLSRDLDGRCETERESEGNTVSERKGGGSLVVGE